MKSPIPIIIERVDIDQTIYRNISLQVFLEGVEKQPEFILYTWPLAVVDVVDSMLEIASIMRRWEESNWYMAILSTWKI